MNENERGRSSARKAQKHIVKSGREEVHGRRKRVKRKNLFLVGAFLLSVSSL